MREAAHLPTPHRSRTSPHLRLVLGGSPWRATPQAPLAQALVRIHRSQEGTPARDVLEGEGAVELASDWDEVAAAAFLPFQRF